MGLHDLTFAGTFVVYAAKMEYAVDDNTQQFSIITCADRHRIGRYSVERYEDITLDELAMSVVESNDIGVIIVIEELSVDIENLVVIAKDICNLPDYSIVLTGNSNNPPLDFFKIKTGHLYPAS